MLDWLLEATARSRIAELEADRAALEQQVRALKLELDCKQLECDMQGELLTTYRQQVLNLLASLAIAGKPMGAVQE
jgi:hypothetical protein